MTKKRSTKSKSKLIDFSHALLYAIIIIVPPMIPFFLVNLYDKDHHVSGSDMRVEVTREALEEDYDDFNPRKIFNIGMYIDDISNIRIGDRTFQGRFTYWAKNFFDKSENDRSEIAEDFIEIVNAERLNLEKKSLRYIDEENENYLKYVSYEGNATLKDEYYLADYPFDSHKLSFIFEPKDSTAEDILLEVDPNSSLSGDFSIGEWNVKSFTAYSEVKTAKSDYSDPELIESGSLWTYLPRVVFEIEVDRQILSHLIKEILPLFIILIMAYTNLFIKNNEYYNNMKIKIFFTAFLSVAALHWVASGKQTGVSYLTAMDQFFLVGYSLVLLLIIEAVFSRALCKEDDEKKNMQNHPWLKYGIKLLIFIYPAILIGSWYWIAFSAMA